MNDVTEMALIFVCIGVLGFVGSWIADRIIEAVKRRRRQREAIIRIKLENEMLRRENAHLKLLSDVRDYYDCFIK